MLVALLLAVGAAALAVGGPHGLVFMMADGAASGGAEQGVTAGNVANHRSDGGSAETACIGGRRACQCEGENYGGDGDGLHWMVSLLT